MAYKILYIEDQKADSRSKDLEEIGYEIKSYDPSPNMNEVISVIKEYNPDAIIMDYRLTKGENNICYDAPTIAATLRSKHSEGVIERPIILMSNEDNIVDYYKDFTNQDLFDFSITKKNFSSDKVYFKNKVNAFINTYTFIKKTDFNLSTIFGLDEFESNLIHPIIHQKLNFKKGFVYEHSRFINDKIIYSIGVLIGEDVLSARLGISKDSADWEELLKRLDKAKYSGVFSDIHSRWWMEKINLWWNNQISDDIPLRRLNAEERVNLIKEKLNLKNLEKANKTKYSNSSNFWTICKFSKLPLDPFDGIEILNKDYLPWQEKEYISFDSVLTEIENYKDIISEIDKKAIRELAENINQNNNG